MIRRAARFILDDLSRTGRELLAIRELIPTDILMMARDFLVVLAHIVMLFEFGIVMTMVMAMVLGLLGVFSWPGVAIAVVCGVLLLPTIRVANLTSSVIQGLNEWSPSRPGLADRGPTSSLWDRELDGAMGVDTGLYL